MNQRQLVQNTLTGFPETTQTQHVVDEVLDRDKSSCGGTVFHGSKTPRNSVRRTLTSLQSAGLVIKDGKGFLRVNVGKLRDTIIQGDVLDVLKLCPDNSIPVIHADPPWSYLSKHLAKGSQTRMMGAGNQFCATEDLPEDVIQEIHRVLQPGGVFLCWFPPAQEEGQDVWIDTLNKVRATGLNLMREICWSKGKGGGYGWAPSSESCFAWYKGTRPSISNGGLYDLSITNVIEHPRMHASHKTRYTDYTAADEADWEQLREEYGSNKKIPVNERPKAASHQAEKPVKVLMDILRVVLGPGKHGRAPRTRNLVMDLYSGSGAACEATKRLGASFVAVEVDARNCRHLISPRLGNPTMYQL